jgi:glycosyltransferase involved in cell wall biosynthesis
MDVLILLPVFNDWPSANELLLRLDQVFAAADGALSVILIDDGSTEAPSPQFGRSNYKKIGDVSILKLRTNLGHQRALAVGLSYAADKIKSDIVVVMDSDGEDEPADAFRLVEQAIQLGSRTVVFAQRTRRSESLIFRAGYLVYQTLHYILTGKGTDIGNFSAIPSALLPSITLRPMLWNHYAASVVGSRQSIATLPTRRGQRIDGHSHLNFVALVIHGLQALACYSEIIGVRVIIATGLVSVVAFASLLLIVFLKLFTNFAIPGWSSLIALMISVVLLQIVSIASNFTMQIISARSVQPFLPIRDYIWFVSELQPVYPTAL